MLHFHETPKRHGLVNSLDNNILDLGHPVVAPGFSSPTSCDEESFKSFRVAPSLCSPSTFDGDLETGTAVIVQGELVKSMSGMDLEEGKSVKAGSAPVRTTLSPMLQT